MTHATTDHRHEAIMRTTTDIKTSIDQPRLNPMFRLQWEEVQQSWVILYPEGMIRLNPSAAEILRRCDGAHTPCQIVSELEQAFGAMHLTPEVESFLTHAHEKGWLS